MNTCQRCNSITISSAGGKRSYYVIALSLVRIRNHVRTRMSWSCILHRFSQRWILSHAHGNRLHDRIRIFVFKIQEDSIYLVFRIIFWNYRKTRKAVLDRAGERGGGMGVSYPGPRSVGGAPRSLGVVRQPARGPRVTVVSPGLKLALNGPGPRSRTEVRPTAFWPLTSIYDLDFQS